MFVWGVEYVILCNPEVFEVYIIEDEACSPGSDAALSEATKVLNPSKWTLYRIPAVQNIAFVTKYSHNSSSFG